MSYSSTGSGTLAYRVAIDGCPFEPVTHPRMVTGTAIGDRVEGLKLADARFSIKADPVQCKLDVGGIDIALVDIDQMWSRVFDLEPTATTWLTADVTATDGTIPCASTAGFDASGYIWIDGETVSYSGVTGTSFTGCTRGQLSADAPSSARQYHYIGDGERLRAPEITNWPVLWEGRRISVYRYDDGDSLLGDGSLIYRGVITSSPRFDGTAWRIGIDHVGSVLEQTFGEDLSTALKPRGIHYPSGSPFQLNWAQDQVSGVAFVSNTYGGVAMSGFWETQADFCDSLTTELATSLAANGGLGTFTAIDQGAVGWYLKYTTDAVTATECFVQIVSIWPGSAGGMPVLVVGTPLDPPLGAGPGNSPVDVGNYGFPQFISGDVTGALVGSPLVIGTDYYFYRPLLTTSLGGVPRGVWSSTADVDGRTIYLSGSTPISSGVSSIVASGTDPATGDYEETYQVESVDAVARSIVISGFTPSSHFFLPDSLPELRLGLSLQSTTFPLASSIADVMDYVAANSTQYATLGILPALRDEDYDSARWHDIFDSPPPLNTQRVFVTFSPVSLAEVVREELKAASCFLSLDNSGRLIPSRLRLPAETEFASVATIDEDTLLTDKALVSHEVSGLGQVNQVLYRDGFNPSSGDFDGDTYQVRDVSAFGQSPNARTMEVAQKSQYILTSVPLDQRTILSVVGLPLFGALAGKYAVDTVDAAKSDAVEVGSPIRFDCPYLVEGDSTLTSGVPNASLGILGRVGIVLGKEWGAYDPRVRFTVLNSKQRLGGYVPAAEISAWVNTSGTTWTLTVSNGYHPSGSDTSDWFIASDVVRVVKWNSTSASDVLGAVVSATSTSVVVTLSGAWVPGSDSWYLTFATTADAITRQRAFCFVAD